MKGAAWGPGSVCSVAQQLFDIFICRPQALARNWELNALWKGKKLKRIWSNWPRAGRQPGSHHSNSCLFVAGKAPLQGLLGTRLGSKRPLGPSSLSHVLFRCSARPPAPGAATLHGVWHGARSTHSSAWRPAAWDGRSQHRNAPLGKWRGGQSGFKSGDRGEEEYIG